MIFEADLRFGHSPALCGREPTATIADAIPTAASATAPATPAPTTTPTTADGTGRAHAVDTVVAGRAISIPSTRHAQRTQSVKQGRAADGLGHRIQPVDDCRREGNVVPADR